MNQENPIHHEKPQKMTTAEENQQDENSATSYGSNSLGMGLEQTTTLFPLNDEPAGGTPTITNTKGNGYSSNHKNNYDSTTHRQQQLSASSQHTEVEFYSSDEEEEEEEEEEDFCHDYEEDGSSFDCNSDDNDKEPCSAGAGPTRKLKRDTSRQSIQSVASDAFSLPVGAQDDVSSLEYDQNHADDDDEFGVDDLSLKEAEENDDGEKLSSSQHQHRPKQGQPQQQHIKPLVEVDTSEMIKSPMMERTTVDMSRLQSLKEAFSSSKKMLHTSLSGDMGLDHLPEAVNEDDDDDDDEEDDEEQRELQDGVDKNTKMKKTEDDDEKSIDFDDLFPIPKLALPGGSKNDSRDDLPAITTRLHRSLFLPPGTSLLAYSPSTTPRARNRKQPRHSSAFGNCNGGAESGVGSPNSSSVHRAISFQMIDDYGILAQNLPPELDLVEARKYIIQLAEGVPDTPTGKWGGDPIPPQSNAKSSMVESSEYTEEVLDEDEEYDGFDPRLPKTPPAGSSSVRNQQQQQQPFRVASRESFLSCDFTEVVEDESEEEEEFFLEEEVIEDEEEAKEEVVDEKETQQETPDAPTNAALGVAASMVGATTA